MTLFRLFASVLSLAAISVSLSACVDEVPGECHVTAENIRLPGDAVQVCITFVTALEDSGCIDVYGYTPVLDSAYDFCNSVIDDSSGSYDFDLRTECPIVHCAMSQERGVADAGVSGDDFLQNLVTQEISPTLSEEDKEQATISVTEDGHPRVINL